MFQTAEIAYEMLEALKPLLEKIERRDRDLGRQARKAGTSVYLNIEERARRRGRDRFYSYNVAAGSAAETRAALRASIALGYLSAADTPRCLGLIDRVLAMLWRLCPR
jgi:four helix bundle protein